MPKRKFPDDETSSEDAIEVEKRYKHTLDSDEEDGEEDESDKYALKDDDIEGQEDGVAGLEEGVQFTPFNMDEEMEEGHFDENGMYHWKKEKLIRDNWLENIDWIKVKQQEEDTSKRESSDDEMPDSEDLLQLYKSILTYMKPKETITHTLKRLGGTKSLSASERLKLKKAGKSLEGFYNGEPDKVTKLTELANKILTAAGNMDIYQETYEFINDKINASSSKQKKEPELDMYADDFGEKEKERLGEPTPDIKEDSSANVAVIMWEYKEKENSEEIKGPYSTEQMAKWSETGHFQSSVLVRKCGSEQFYTSNRIDFDLYL